MTSIAAARTAPPRRRLLPTLTAFLAAALLAACGGGEGDERAAAFTDRAAAQAAADAGAAVDGRRQALNFGGAPATAADFFDWVQWKYPTLAPPAGAVAVVRDAGGQTFDIRVYASGIIAGVSRTTGFVYALLPSAPDTLVTLGTLVDFAPVITADTCGFRPTACPQVNSATAGTPAYSRPLQVTLTGLGVDTNLVTLASPGCTGFQRAANATTTSAVYTCTVVSQGPQEVTVRRASDNSLLATVPYNVPVPQVRMTVTNGAGVNGSLLVTLYPVQRPITVTNFLNYVNSGFYDGTVFHRNSPNFVLQGGGFASPLVPSGAVPPLKATNAPITLELGQGLSNTRLTVAMARTSVLNSATSQFFINLADSNSFLDTTAGGYAVFGLITEGEDLVAAMRSAPCVAWPALVGQGECVPSPNLVITTARQTR
jgi:cyclophilin family peptidyl-prolyl cis-trans isomerase